MCLLLCLMFALRKNQEQKNSLNPCQGSKSKPELQPEVCRPHCPPGTGKNFVKKKSLMCLKRASVPAAERMLQRTVRGATIAKGGRNQFPVMPLRHMSNSKHPQRCDADHIQLLWETTEGIGAGKVTLLRQG